MMLACKAKAYPPNIWPPYWRFAFKHTIQQNDALVAILLNHYISDYFSQIEIKFYNTIKVMAMCKNIIVLFVRFFHAYT